MNVAICLRGAVGKIGQRLRYPDSLYQPGTYVNYVSVYNSIKKHILDANANVTFDFFIHCWNTDLEKELVTLYNPKNYQFENNNIYKEEIISNLEKTNRPLNCFAMTSQLLTISKSIAIMKASGFKYDRVILYRPDVLLWKDMNLKLYDEDKIYVNAHPGCDGDFHFVMNQEASYKFALIYDTIKTGKDHGKIRKYVSRYMNQELFMDDIVPGLHQEVLRKLKRYSIDHYKIPLDFFYQYGLTRDELLLYGSM